MVPARSAVPLLARRINAECAGYLDFDARAHSYTA